MTLPAGFEWVTEAPRAAFARPEAAAWVRKSLAEHVTLWLAVRRRGPAFTLQGRAPIMVTRANPGDEGGDGHWVVRRYWRGGAMRWLSDRHLRRGVPRPVIETGASEALRARGIETPRVVAGAVYERGLIYRADLVTEFVPDAVDLVSLLFAPNGEWAEDPELRLETLVRVGAAVVKLAHAGAQHPDLNAGNILVQKQGETVTPWILDLDRCRVAPGPVDPKPMVERLRRSAVKIGESLGAMFPIEAWTLLARGAAAAEQRARGGTDDFGLLPRTGDT